MRIVLLEKTDVDLEVWRDQIRQYAGLEGLFDDVEVVCRFDRSLSVEVSRRDAFVATSCWSAHVAHQAVRELKRARFVFLIQEYEPVFVPKGSIHALFEEAYTFPQHAVFSTEMLRDYFRMNRIGVYAESQGHGDARSTSFENAVLKAAVDRSMLQRSMKRLLFYARPEPHAARNMFELGMMSLTEVLRKAQFDVSRWSFHGIGSIDLSVRLELAPRVELHLVPRMSPQEYLEMLPTFDVGLALMLTPHPSLVPLEMAGAGLWTVTNSFANKTPERLEAVSSNLIVVPPTVSGIGDGLRRAIRSVNDLEGRVEGSNIRWPTNWEAALNDEVMARVKSFLGEM